MDKSLSKSYIWVKEEELPPAVQRLFDYSQPIPKSVDFLISPPISFVFWGWLGGVFFLLVTIAFFCEVPSAFLAENPVERYGTILVAFGCLGLTILFAQQTLLLQQEYKLVDAGKWRYGLFLMDEGLAYRDIKHQVFYVPKSQIHDIKIRKNSVPAGSQFTYPQFRVSTPQYPHPFWLDAQQSYDRFYQNQKLLEHLQAWLDA